MNLPGRARKIAYQDKINFIFYFHLQSKSNLLWLSSWSQSKIDLEVIIVNSLIFLYKQVKLIGQNNDKNYIGGEKGRQN
jgi:hypothetical protein